MARKTFSGFKRGIDRTTHVAEKGEYFWDLQNCYVTPGKVVKKRPGFRYVGTLGGNTKGLTASGGKLHTYFTGAEPATKPAFCEHHGLVVAGSTTLKRVSDAFLFIGSMYVVAEFDDGIHHFWLRNGELAAWQPNHVYDINDVVRPTSDNGYAYRATVSNLPDAWTPNTKYAVGDEVQPTEYNGYKYVMQSSLGRTPISGPNEPAWVAAEGAKITDNDSTKVEVVATTGAPKAPPKPPGGRYFNVAGVSKPPELPGGD